MALRVLLPKYERSPQFNRGFNDVHQSRLRGQVHSEPAEISMGISTETLYGQRPISTPRAVLYLLQIGSA